ncbi:hypothetical protein F5B21DRAFT_474409 [Xylaria acuta]|nr:hypothetical protein F5B21DRAFT_474409 [Xylaria acuta]
MGGTGMADWALSVTWRRGYQRNVMRTIMSDAGLAGPLPELLFPSVVLATALILLFNAVVNFVRSHRPAIFSISLLNWLRWRIVIYLVLHSCYGFFASSPTSVSLHLFGRLSHSPPTSLAQ